MFTSLRLDLLKLFDRSSFFLFQIFYFKLFQINLLFEFFLNLHYFPIFPQKNLQGTKIHCQKKERKKSNIG